MKEKNKIFIDKPEKSTLNEKFYIISSINRKISTSAHPLEDGIKFTISPWCLPPKTEVREIQRHSRVAESNKRQGAPVLFAQIKHQCYVLFPRPLKGLSGINKRREAMQIFTNRSIFGVARDWILFDNHSTFLVFIQHISMIHFSNNE